MKIFNYEMHISMQCLLTFRNIYTHICTCVYFSQKAVSRTGIIRFYLYGLRRTMVSASHLSPETKRHFRISALFFVGFYLN